MELFRLDRYRGKSICVALSGGADSVCLLHCFFSHAEAYEIKLSAVHVEHGIRGKDSLDDMRFCETLCEKWKIPLRVVRIDLPALARARKTGLEETGRAVRYEIFHELLSEGACDLVATAHNRNDVAETLLFRLARGTGLSGMKAISDREGIVRPLLCIPRSAIEAYLSENGLSHVEDATNADERYTRNYIRHYALPAYEKIYPNAAEHLLEFAARATADDEYLYDLAKKEIKVSGEEFHIPADLPDSLFGRAALLCMRLEKDYTGAHVKELSGLKYLQSGKKISLPGGLEAVKEYGEIVFYHPLPPIPERPFLPEYGEFVFADPLEEGERAVDLDAFPQGCVLRTRREGDFILSGGNRKTLKKYFTDKKISARRGRGILLVACGAEIFAAAGVGISDKVKVTEKTVRRGYIR